MKTGIAVFLIMCLTAVLVYSVFYFTTHDSVDSVIDVNSIRLDKGRVVNLIGINPSALYEQTDSTRVLVSIDSTSVAQVEEFLGESNIELEFCNTLEPDTASVDIAAYVKLPDGTDYNGWLLSMGLAEVNREHKHPRAEIYQQLENEAKAAGKGIWAVQEEPDSTVTE